MRLKTGTLVWLSAVALTGGAMLAGQAVIASVFAVGHVLFWQLHVIEVKINALLKERGIFVADYELTE